MSEPKRVHWKWRNLAIDHLRAIYPYPQPLSGGMVEQTARLLQDLAKSLPKEKRKKKRKPDLTGVIVISFEQWEDDESANVGLDIRFFDAEGREVTPSSELLLDIYNGAIEHAKEAYPSEEGYTDNEQ